MAIIDIRQLVSNAIIQNFDICIVGSGAAGLSIAQSFFMTPLKVCILESGGFDLDEETQALYKGQSDGIPCELDTTRMRYFGGTTNIWSGWCTPLSDEDFHNKPWIPYSGWPIQKEDLNEYYQHAAHILNIKNQFDVHTEEPQKAAVVSGELSPALWRFSTKKGSSEVLHLREKYKDLIQKSRNISLYLYANLTDILLNDALSHVESIEVKTLKGARFNIQAKYFVLACGGIENPRILLNASKQTKNGLGNDHNLVGRFFQEHLHIYDYISIFHLETDHALLKYGTNDYQNLYKTKKYNCGIVLSPDVRKRNLTLAASFDLYQSSIFGNGWNIKEIEPDLNVLKEITGAKKEFTKYVNPIARLEQSPNPNSKVALTTEKDALGMHFSKLHWEVKPQDFLSLQLGTKLLASLFGGEGLGVTHYNDKKLLETGIPEKIYGGSHHMGTTRMHDDFKQGVVDKNCKIHGIDNLYIAGSSVFPTSGWANPTFTIVALAIRLSDHIKQKLAYKRHI